LFQIVAVLLQQQGKKLAHVVADQIDLQAIVLPGPGDRLLRQVQPQQGRHRQQMDAPQVYIAIGRREAVEMRPAHGDEQEWMGQS